MLGRRRFLKGLVVSSGSLALHKAIPQPVASDAPPQTKATALSAQDLENALIGSSYLGCGGGGGLDEARALIQEDLAAGLSFRMVKVADLADEDVVACPYGLGSLAPLSADMQAELDAVPGPVISPTEASFALLSRHMNTDFAGVILGEIGPLSMAEGLSIAARLGVPALDADTVGRATPEINQHSVRVSGQPLTPAACATGFGDDVILTDLRMPSRQETLFRKLTDVSGAVGVTDAPIKGRVAKNGSTLIQDSLSLAKSIGEAVTSAKAKGVDAIEAARVAGDGYTLFQGRIGDFSYQDLDGFLDGVVSLSGVGVNAGQTMVLRYKNEHLVAELDGKIVVTCPDLITLIDEETAEGLRNPDFKAGTPVRVLGFKCHPLWRTKAGLDVFSPQYFGYDAEYIPIEQRI